MKNLMVIMLAVVLGISVNAQDVYRIISQETINITTGIVKRPPTVGTIALYDNAMTILYNDKIVTFKLYVDTYRFITEPSEGHQWDTKVTKIDRELTPVLTIFYKEDKPTGFKLVYDDIYWIIAAEKIAREDWKMDHTNDINL